MPPNQHRIHQTSVHIEIQLPKNRDQQPITLFFARSGRRVKHELHCLACGLPFYGTTYELRSTIDNGDVVNDEGIDYSEVMCKRCKQVYRIILL